MNPKQRLIYEALRFVNWAAGEGISPVDEDAARAPDEFMLDYSDATGDEDWKTLAERISAQQ